jgi:hypothetical protein
VRAGDRAAAFPSGDNNRTKIRSSLCELEKAAGGRLP